MTTALLERVTLHGFDASYEGIEAFALSTTLVPSLDVEKVRCQAIDERHAAVYVGFSVDFLPSRVDEAITYVSASFRLLYTFEAPRKAGALTVSAQRELATARAVIDAWPYWLEFLATSLIRMDLPTLRLPATPPTRLIERAGEAFDHELNVAACRSAKTWTGHDIDAARASLPRDEIRVFDAIWPLICRRNEANQSGQAAPSPPWEAQLDAIWRDADPRVVGRLVERLTTPQGSPIASVEWVELRNAAAVAQLRAAGDRSQYERAVAAVAQLAKKERKKTRLEPVGPAGNPAFRTWVTSPDRLAVEVDGEVWNAAPLDDETLVVSRML